MNVLIIEDEIKTAKELSTLIEGMDDDIKVIDIVQSVKAAINWFNHHTPPDLIFSDIKLADGLSFDIYRNVTVNAPVIFCTAFDEYAIRAFEANSIDYLLKPIDEVKLQQSIEKYQNFKYLFDQKPEQYSKNLVKLTSHIEANFKRTILVFHKEKIIPVKTADITYIYTAFGSVYINTNSNLEFTTQYTMDQIEVMLDPHQFNRANRQFIINREIIQTAEHYFNRRLFLKISCETPEKVLISKPKVTEFLRWLES